MIKDQTQNKTRKHCMVVHAYYPLGETRVERQAQALVGHGTEVDVICLRIRGEPTRATVDEVNVYRLPVWRFANRIAVQLLEYVIFFVLASIRLTILHLRHRYDVVQVHNLPDFLVFVALIPKMTGARVVLDLHDLMPEMLAEQIQKPMNSLTVRLLLWQERLSCRFADHVITVTELWRQALIERGQPASKVTVVMNVADDRVFQRTDLPDADAIGNGHESKARGNGRFRMIYHGAIHYRHGLDLAVKAIDIVRRKAPDVHLTIHGGGPHRATLKEMIKELGLENHVVLSYGLVPLPELLEMIQMADLGVVPYRDGVFTGGILPTKLMEFAALGIPAIASRTPAIAAYFDDTSVQFFSPGEKEELAKSILKLYYDRSRLALLAHNICEFNKRYSWSKQSAAYVGLVDRLIENKK
jgi:glycosyltransferase involved in cell wall biosynthesis